jgi:hypothetical protein
MPFQQRAIFIGGPYDGLTKVFPFGVNDLVVFEFDLRRGYRVRTKRYFKVHESANASTVTFELEEPEKHFFVVEVDTADGAAEAQVEKILDDLLKHIDGHHEAFPSGVEAARVTKD